MNKIKTFQGKYRWLSNFWPCTVYLEGLKFNHVEGAYVAAKTTDIKIRQYIQLLEKPNDCKRYGRKIKIRNDWEGIKILIMEDLIRQKFTRNMELQQKLLETGDMIIQEGNTWGDTFWGIDLKTGKGQNHLGKIIMKIRNELKKVK